MIIKQQYYRRGQAVIRFIPGVGALGVIAINGLFDYEYFYKKSGSESYCDRDESYDDYMWKHGY